MERYRHSPVGQLVPIEVHDIRFEEKLRHWAFVPNPLPPTFAISDATWGKVSDAALALGRLDAATKQLPNPSLLVRPAIRREAISTSALEGTYAALSEVLEAELLGDREVRADVLEVRNYVRAAEHALTLLESRPISVNMIAELQAMLVKGTRGDSYQAGAVRRHQVWIGPKDCPVTEARFVPPPPGDVLIQGLSDWEKWIHGDAPAALIVRVAAGHYQFETLHPFNDGNGRLGRLIAILQLVEDGMLQHPVLYVSPYLEARREEYVAHLAAVSASGDFDRWISFFAQAIRHQADDALARTRRLLELRDQMVAKLRAAKVRGAALPIAESLIGYPFIDVNAAARVGKVSYQAANGAVARLTELGILREVTGNRYGRVFACRDVMRIIEP